MSIWLETFEIELISGETFISNVQQFKSKLVKITAPYILQLDFLLTKPTQVIGFDFLFNFVFF